MVKCVAKGTSTVLRRLYVRVSPSASVAVTAPPMAVPPGVFSSTVNSRGSGAGNTGGLRLGHSTVELLSTGKSSGKVAASLPSVSWMGLVAGTV